MVLTIIGLLYILNGIAIYYQASFNSYLFVGFIFGLYLFACLVCEVEYKQWYIEPKNFSIFKFIRVVFLPSIIGAIFLNIFLPDLTINYELRDIMLISRDILESFIFDQSGMVLFLPLILGIFFYFGIVFVVQWYLIIIYKLTIIPFLN
jgi:hypothetical protein